MLIIVGWYERAAMIKGKELTLFYFFVKGIVTGILKFETTFFFLISY